MGKKVSSTRERRRMKKLRAWKKKTDLYLSPALLHSLLGKLEEEEASFLFFLNNNKIN